MLSWKSVRKISLSFLGIIKVFTTKALILIAGPS